MSRLARPLPRVVVVEDDAMIQRFVRMALAGVAIDLCVVGGVSRALEALQGRRAALVLTDLMLPDGSGQDLLARLHGDAALRGDAELAVFSAGLDAPTLAHLQSMGVTRVLRKPVSIAALRQAVLEAVRSRDPTPSDVPPQARSPAVDDASAIALHFEGDARLFASFKSACLAQFERDVETGDRAVAQHDVAAARRLGHSLKTVLASLGRPDLADGARRFEQAAVAGEPDGLDAHWAWIRDRLDAYRAAGGA